MKKIILVAGLVGALALASSARVPELAAAPSNAAAHRVVFELTSDDAQTWEGVLDNVENVQKALGPTSVEVVVHGKGLAMLTTAKNRAVHERLERSATGGVVFAACENAMKKQGAKKEDLVPFAKTVDSGVAELVRKQESGWSYLRSGT